MESSQEAPKELEVAERLSLKMLLEVHRLRLKNPEAKLPPHFLSEEELEHRYKLDFEAQGIHSLGDLEKFLNGLAVRPGGKKRIIDQVNVAALNDKGKKETFRVRHTQIIDDAGSVTEDLYRVALKTDTRDGAKEETQLVVDAKDPFSSAILADVKDLFYNKGHNPCIRTRYYYWHHLPNGNTCEVHTEIYNYPEKLTDLTRVEVEYQGTHKFDDAKYVEEHPGSLPMWVGVPVTEDKAWTNKSLVEKGMPEDARRKLEALKAASRRN